MFARISQWLQRHPALRDALLWCLPALAVGALFRGLLLSYSPYAYWGSDSESYMGFAYNLLEHGRISLQEKRRYVYPLLMLVPSLTPGGVLKSVAWLQHAGGLLTLVAFGYTIRKLFVGWRLWIIPLTLVLTTFPMFLWYEHELLAEALFYYLGIWAVAGWVAWGGEAHARRAGRLWWLFFVPFAMLMLIKPSTRFLWPGVLIALAVLAWQGRMQRRQWAALAALFGLTLTMGQANQGAWLLYTSVFPMTRLDTPLHAEYKAEVADLVRSMRERIHRYASEDSDSGVKLFLKFPQKQEERLLWKELGEEGGKKQARIYSDLAREAILHRPDLFLYVAFQRIIDSANADSFKERRFDADYFGTRLGQSSYRKILRSEGLMARLFGRPAGEPEPSLETVRAWVTPVPDSPYPEFFRAYSTALHRGLALITDSQPEGKGSNAFSFRPTVLGWWVLVGAVLALALPAWRLRLGVWVVIMGGYLVGVFLVGSANPRFFALAWPVILLLAAVPGDVLWQRLRRGHEARRIP